MFWLRRIAVLASMLGLGGLSRVDASSMKLYAWGVIQTNAGSIDIPNREFDVSEEGFSGFTLNKLRHDMPRWQPQGWTMPIEGSITIGLALYDANEQGLAYGYLRGRIDGELFPSGGASNLWGGAAGEAAFDLDDLSYSTHDRWTGQTIPSTINRVPSWFYDLKAVYEGQMTGGSQNIYDSTLTIPAVAAVPEPGSVVVFLTAAGGGFLALRRRRSRS